jgi:HEAT repeat protein
MKKHWPEAALVLCGLAAVCVLLASMIRPRRSVEPEYGEKPLSYWVAQLGGDNGNRARAALRGIGPEGVSFLLKAKRTESFDDRPFIDLSLLGPRAVPALVTAFEDQSPVVRLAAVNAVTALVPQLGRKAEIAVPGVIKLLSDPYAQIRFAALLAWNRIGSRQPEGIAALIGVLGIDDTGSDGRCVFARAKAAQTLGKMGSESRAAVPELTKLLTTADSYTRQQAAIALWQITQETNLAVPAMSELLGNTNLYLRRSTALSLLRIGAQTNLSPALLTRIEAVKAQVPIGMMARLTPTADEQP